MYLWMCSKWGMFFCGEKDGVHLEVVGLGLRSSYKGMTKKSHNAVGMRASKVRYFMLSTRRLNAKRNKCNQYH